MNVFFKIYYLSSMIVITCSHYHRNQKLCHTDKILTRLHILDMMTFFSKFAVYDKLKFTQNKLQKLEKKLTKKKPFKNVHFLVIFFRSLNLITFCDCCV